MIWLWVWGIVTAFALMVEFLTSNLTTVWFAAGGLITLLVVALANNLAIGWQLAIFMVTSTILLICTRKMCLKFLYGNMAPVEDLPAAENTSAAEENSAAQNIIDTQNKN